MADVVVNIRGNASDLQQTLNDVNNRTWGTQGGGGTPSTGDTAFNQRMVEDIRREMQQRGVVMVPGSASMSQIINQYGQSLRQNKRQEIHSEYEQQKIANERERDERLADVERRRKEFLKKYDLEDNEEKLRYTGYYPYYKAFGEERKQIYADFEAVNATLSKENEQQELQLADERLTKAIEELTKHFETEARGGAESSYIAKLREQQREIIQKRDAAPTEEEAAAASRELREVSNKLNAVLRGETSDSVSEQSKRFYDPTTRALGGVQQLFRGIEGGSIMDTALGGAAMFGAMKGMNMGSMTKMLGWVGLIAGIGDWLTGSADSWNKMVGIAGFRAPAMGLHGAEGITQLRSNIPSLTYNGASITELGYNSIEEFGDEAAKRIRARGMSDNWFNETMRQIGYEKGFALNEGSLMKGAQYDRYGVTVTTALERMVAILSSIEKSGVEATDFTRVQEKYDIQQQIMASFMNRQDRPDYDVANGILAAMSSVQGITQDARIGSDYQAFQNAIQNPMNERMQALIYGTVSDLFPETGGRADLIDRAIRNPENEAKILEAVMNRLTEQFGGTDTQMGYFVFKNLFPNISPDRLDEYINHFNTGGFASFYEYYTKGGGDPNKRDWTSGWGEQAFRDATEMTAGWTRAVNDIKILLTEIRDGVTGTNGRVWGNATPPIASGGGNR